MPAHMRRMMANTHASGRLLARPSISSRHRGSRVGTAPLGLGEAGRDGLMHVPPSIQSVHLAPLMILLHGAGGSAAQVLPIVRQCADSHSVLVVAPDSRGPTWDVIQGQYGPDVTFIDNVLEQSFRSYAVDRERIAIAGFSDGASYALSLGLTNGELFSDILSFSPGFAAPTRIEGAPRIFISHGTKDSVLPVDRCGRRLAKWLKQSGCDVDYHEFNGGHVVPADLVEVAFARAFSRPTWGRTGSTMRGSRSNM